MSAKKDSKSVKNEKENSSAYLTWNKKGTEYICIDVANKYLFYFTRTGKSLLEIDDLSHGGWYTYAKKDVEIWLSYSGARELYEKSVLSTLKMFLKKFPA